jgi:hypothetical protein
VFFCAAANDEKSELRDGKGYLTKGGSQEVHAFQMRQAADIANHPIFSGPSQSRAD